MKLAPARRVIGRAATVAALLLIRATCADVLPDDRADLFYSKYSGGGMDITGESVAVRKKFTENFAISGNYFVDKVSGASIDVLSQASQIRDERIQKSATLEFVHDKTTYNATYQTSVERDYRSRHLEHFPETGHVRRLDHLVARLREHRRQDRREQRHGFRARHHLAGACLEPQLRHRSVADPHEELDRRRELQRDHGPGLSGESLPLGSLSRPQNPAKGYSLASQMYPDTRTSTAIQFEAKYFLPYRAAITGSFRYFRDTWSIVGKTFELDYTHPISNVWILEGRVRYYTQNHADFYSDLFDYADEYRFEGRDQDLAAQDNYTIGAKATYAFLPNGWKIFKRATVTLDASRITFHYKDFRNIKDFGLPQYQPGAEPLYQFNATVYQVYMSMFF